MPVNRSSLLVDQDNRPTEALSQLLTLFDVPHDGTLSSIVQSTQKLWYQPGKERWQFEECDEEKKQDALLLLQKLGCLERVLATQTHYDYAILLGGYTPRMQRRIDFLIQEWKRGIRFEQIFILTGQRPLDLEAEESFAGIETETQMLLYLFTHADLPSGLRAIPVHLIDVPMGEKRPTTLDTIRAWLKFKPKPGSALIFGDQPFVTYFDLVFRTYMPPDFALEVVGEAAPNEAGCALFLDNLARCLYQEQQRQKN